MPFKKLKLILLFAIIQACSNRQIEKSDRSRNDTSIFYAGQVDPLKSNDRPNETGEGVPGYLIDSSLIDIRKTAGTLSISGRAGAILGTDKAPVAIDLQVVQVNRYATQNTVQENELVLDVSSKLPLDSDSNGSFTIEIPNVRPTDLLFVQIGKRTQTRFSIPTRRNDPETVWIADTEAKNITPTATQQIQTIVTESEQFDANAIRGPDAIKRVKYFKSCPSCDLAYADFSDLNLDLCNLRSTNLAYAKFVRSSLKACDFSYANVGFSDFSSSTLDDAKFLGSDTSSTVFTGSSTVGTQFP